MRRIAVLVAVVGAATLLAVGTASANTYSTTGRRMRARAQARSRRAVAVRARVSTRPTS